MTMGGRGDPDVKNGIQGVLQEARYSLNSQCFDSVRGIIVILKQDHPNKNKHAAPCHLQLVTKPYAKDANTGRCINYIFNSSWRNTSAPFHIHSQRGKGQLHLLTSAYLEVPKMFSCGSHTGAYLTNMYVYLKTETRAININHTLQLFNIKKVKFTAEQATKGQRGSRR